MNKLMTQNILHGIPCRLLALTLICMAVPLLSGCGGGDSFTPAEKAEVDKYIKEHGRSAMICYLSDEGNKLSKAINATGAGSFKAARKQASKTLGTDEKHMLKYIKYFVSQGADVNAKDDKNIDTSLLLVSYYFCDAEIIKFLVSKGADVNAKSGYGSTPLHDAAKGENIEIVKLLVSKGADVNAKAKRGETPLHEAASDGNIEIVKFLVSKGADVNAKTESGKTPRDVAKQHNKIEVFNLLTP